MNIIKTIIITTVFTCLALGSSHAVRFNQSVKTSDKDQIMTIYNKTKDYNVIASVDVYKDTPHNFQQLQPNENDYEIWHSKWIQFNGKEEKKLKIKLSIQDKEGIWPIVNQFYTIPQDGGDIPLKKKNLWLHVKGTNERPGGFEHNYTYKDWEVEVVEK